MRGVSKEREVWLFLGRDDLYEFLAVFGLCPARWNGFRFTASTGQATICESADLLVRRYGCTVALALHMSCMTIHKDWKDIHIWVTNRLDESLVCVFFILFGLFRALVPGKSARSIRRERALL